MYSYEDRIRAVELYIKLGKRTGAAIRQLGDPTKNFLKSWHEEYERCLNLSRGYVRAKPKYSQAQWRRWEHAPLTCRCCLRNSATG
jgi:transposase-like protein